MSYNIHGTVEHRKINSNVIVTRGPQGTASGWRLRSEGLILLIAVTGAPPRRWDLCVFHSSWQEIVLPTQWGISREKSTVSTLSPMLSHWNYGVGWRHKPAKVVRTIWLQHLSPYWLPELMQVTWLTNPCFPFSLFSAFSFFPETWAQVQRMTCMESSPQR